MPLVPRWMQLPCDAGYHGLPRGQNRGALFADAADHRYFLRTRKGHADQFRSKRMIRFPCFFPGKGKTRSRRSYCKRTGSAASALMSMFPPYFSSESATARASLG